MQYALHDASDVMDYVCSACCATYHLEPTSCQAAGTSFLDHYHGVQEQKGQYV